MDFNLLFVFGGRHHGWGVYGVAIGRVGGDTGVCIRLETNVCVCVCMGGRGDEKEGKFVSYNVSLFCTFFNKKLIVYWWAGFLSAGMLPLGTALTTSQCWTVCRAPGRWVWLIPVLIGWMDANIMYDVTLGVWREGLNKAQFVYEVETLKVIKGWKKTQVQTFPFQISNHSFPLLRL